MFAILVAEENFDKITQNHHYQKTESNHELNLDIFASAAKPYYFISGYIDRRGRVDWVLMPEYIMKRKFEYDEEKIKTDWDQIVEK